MVCHKVVSAIGPSNLWANRSLGLTYNHRNTIDDKYQIETLASINALARELPLIRYNTIVLARIFAKEAYVKVITIFAKRLRVLLK